MAKGRKLDPMSMMLLVAWLTFCVTLINTVSSVTSTWEQITSFHTGR